MIYTKALLSDYDEIVAMKNQVKQRVIDENLPIWKNGYPLDEMIKEDLENGYGRIIKEDNKIIAYAAIMDSNIMYPEEKIFKKDNLYSFGRVMVCNEYLSKGVGKYLVNQNVITKEECVEHELMSKSEVAGAIVDFILTKMIMLL